MAAATLARPDKVRGGGLVCEKRGRAYASYKATNVARHLGGLSEEAACRTFRLAVEDAKAGDGRKMVGLRRKLATSAAPKEETREGESKKNTFSVK